MSHHPSTDPELPNILAQIRADRRKLAESPSGLSQTQRDSLRHRVSAAEFTLRQKNVTIDRLMESLSVDWREIAAALAPGEVAMEIVESDTYEDEKIAFGMLYVTHGCDAPRYLRPVVTRPGKFLDQKYLTTGRLSELFWKQVEDSVPGVTTIYFSPAGDLHNVALESVPDWRDTTRMISERLSLHRVSSTRHLLARHHRGQPQGALIYGGLLYDVDDSVLAADARRYPDMQRHVGTVAFEADSALRAGVGYLPGTKAEAEGIYTAMRHSNVNACLLTDSAGTETSFKNMSGKIPGILHIATHGFFWNERTLRRMPPLAFLTPDSPENTEDKALTRSGLLMTGANNTLRGGAIPAGLDDGVLTAAEISRLDLHRLDLVVLSACQTALGDISGEGVFGLQRGFKKAGAQTMLMSLWKVDDHATQLLMSKFYEHLLDGKTKREALVLAQKYVRDYQADEPAADQTQQLTASQTRRRQRLGMEDMPQSQPAKTRPYRHPRYWGAFILLDD